MKILVIDDEEDVRYVARVSLGRVGGMEVIEAASGQEGIEAARAERPDCILLDMMMPGMDGEETLLALRREPDTASIPVVFLTAVGATVEARRIRQLGAKGLILKPFDPMRLASTIDEVLST